MTQDDIQARLFALQDEKYAVFIRRLTPNVPPERFIGVRTPALRALAKELSGSDAAAAFLQSLPHFYYEENNLHAFLLETLRDFDAALAGVEAFLPWVDNWATCDQLRPRVFSRRLPALLERVPVWLASDREYTVRFGLEMLMNFCLDGAFRPEYLQWAADVHREEYYINMMRAWVFATALAKQREAALPYLRERRLDPWTHNKTIQKAVESRRISDEDKAYLRTLRV